MEISPEVDLMKLESNLSIFPVVISPLTLEKLIFEASKSNKFISPLTLFILMFFLHY